MSQFVSAAAGLLLPAAVWAQDLGDQNNLGELDRGTIGSSTSGEISNSGSTPNSGSYSSGGTFSNGSSQSSSSQPGTFSGGIMVQDGAAYVIHRLQNEMSLPDGSKIEPNGTIKQSDGSMRSLGSGQILTLDGRVMSAPFGNSGSSTSTNPGNPSSEQSSSSSGLPPATSNTPSNGSEGSNSNTLNNGSTSPSPADQSDGSGLAPGATSTDPTQDYTD